MNSEVFDVDQGHGNHIDTILDGMAIDDLLKTLPDLLQTAKVIATPEKEISCSLGDDYPKQMMFALLGNTDSNARLSLLIGCNVTAQRNELLSFYPEYDGMKVSVNLTDIHEWANGVEATLEGTILGGERNVAFFDTRYIANKGTYEIGKTYTFRLTAFAFNGEILQQKTFQFEGDDAVRHRERCGQEPEYDENGNPLPVIFDVSQLVAYLPYSTAYPHEAEFQSPVFAVKKEHAFSGDFYALEIAIAHDDTDDDEVRIPLITKQSFFDNPPMAGDPIRGKLWTQGYRVKD